MSIVTFVIESYEKSAYCVSAPISGKGRKSVPVVEKILAVVHGSRTR